MWMQFQTRKLSRNCYNHSRSSLVIQKIGSDDHRHLTPVGADKMRSENHQTGRSKHFVAWDLRCRTDRCPLYNLSCRLRLCCSRKLCVRLLAALSSDDHLPSVDKTCTCCVCLVDPAWHKPQMCCRRAIHYFSISQELFRRGLLTDFSTCWCQA